MEEVREMLVSFRLEQYADQLDAQGYDDLNFLIHLSADEAKLRDIVEHMGMKPGHIAKLCKMLPSYCRPSCAR